MLFSMVVLIAAVVALFSWRALRVTTSVPPARPVVADSTTLSLPGPGIDGSKTDSLVAVAPEIPAGATVIPAGTGKPEGRAVLSDDPELAAIEKRMAEAAMEIERAQFAARASDADLAALQAEKNELQRRLSDRLFKIPSLAEKMSARTEAYEKLRPVEEKQAEIRARLNKDGENAALRSELASLDAEHDRMVRDAVAMARAADQERRSVVESDEEAGRLAKAIERCEDEIRGKLNALPVVVEMRKRRIDLQREYNEVKVRRL